MAASTLDPDNIPEPDRRLGSGHGANLLGPSDLSDTGSDVQGGFRAIEEPEFGLGLDRGTNEDPDTHSIEASSDTEDSTGTGGSSTAGRNADVDLASDIDVDRIDEISKGDEENP